MNLLEQLASGLLNYSRSEPEGLLARGLRQPAGLLGRGLNTFDRAMNMTPAQYSPDGLLGMQYRMNNPSVMDTAEDRRNLGAAYGQALVTGPLGMAPYGWTAYHGSPHKFDKFSMDRIGTGEGAQAYGHGLYFADNPGVAKTYMPRLTSFEETAVLPVYQKAGKDIDKAIHSAPNQAVKDRLMEWKRQGMPGAIYKVDISDARAPKEAFLDWDKPLSQQSPAVQRALMNLPTAHKLSPEMTVAQLLESTHLVPGKFADKKAAAEALRKAGIPGVRYLDAGSRASGGTYNTVLFDDSLVNILERQ